MEHGMTWHVINRDKTVWLITKLQTTMWVVYAGELSAVKCCIVM